MRNNSGVLWLLMLAVVVVFVLRQSLRREEPVVRRPLPPLMAAGWINSDPPSPEALRGKLVVIDAWATWCGFCIKELPDLIEFHRQAGDQVVLIGLTEEPESKAITVREFVENHEGMTWPIGYGALPTIDMLGKREYPTFYLFGRDGMLIWKGHRVSELEDAVVKAMGM